MLRVYRYAFRLIYHAALRPNIGSRLGAHLPHIPPDSPPVCEARHLAAMSVVSSYSSSSYSPSPSPRSRLSLAGQSLTSLPQDMERRILEGGLEELNLAQNSLSPLPTTLLGSLTGLRKLDVSDNGLHELPHELCQLRRLEVLIVKRNALKSFPGSFAQLSSSLRELNASGNLLEKFPPQIVCLAKLESLHLGGNRLRAVPRSIGQLKE